MSESETHHFVASLNGGSTSIDGEFRALDEARTIGREKDSCFGNFLGLGRTPGRRLSGQLLKPFAERIRAFGVRGSRAYCIDTHSAWAVFRGRRALREPELTAMEMSGVDLDRLAGRALGTFRFL